MASTLVNTVKNTMSLVFFENVGMTGMSKLYLCICVAPLI